MLFGLLLFSVFGWGQINFEVFVSLSCHNCPEVVQAVNQFALINPKISSEMIDGGLFQEMVESRGIQGVPSVYLNGKPFATGKVEVGQLFAKLQDKFPDVGKKVKHQQLPTQDVTVSGGGPGGVAAAIYAARKGNNEAIKLNTSKLFSMFTHYEIKA